MCEVDWAMLLEYLKVLFSWPPVLAVLLYWFIKRFTEQISALISKIKGFKLPGGSEVTLSEIEQQQEIALPPTLDFPGLGIPVETSNGHADLLAPNATMEAQGGPSIDFSYMARTQALYPNVDPDAAVRWMHHNPGPALDDYIDKTFQLHCERTFNIIFGTQVLVLVFLDNPALTSASPAADLVSLYERHLELTSGSGRSLNDFLEFLVIRSLVVNIGPPEGPLYLITKAGSEFLRHIKQYYPLQWNTKEF